MILVTSANGNQGSRLVPQLVAAGHRVRACVRSAASAAALRASGVAEVLVGDLTDRDFLAAAAGGVTSVYHIGPTLHPDERTIGCAMIDAARAAGVDHFVFSSVLHAITTDLIQHEAKRDIEEHLLSSGLGFTILQPANYMLAHRLEPVFAEGIFRLSWALDRRQSMVDLDDVTTVAAAVLGAPDRHLFATYELAAPGWYTAHDIGRVLSDVLGREIAVAPLDPELFNRARFGGGDAATRDYQLRASRAIAARYSSHDFVGNANVLGFLLGRPPATFADFVRKEVARRQAT